MPEKYYKYYISPVGRLCVAEDGKGICSISFFDADEDCTEKETELINTAIGQLKEYFNGERKVFDLPLSLKGTDFQKQVWNELIKIPYGKTVSYSDIAKNINNDKASRAVGMANNKNKIPIIIPCHRVIGKNGSLTGYAGGLNIKEKLLNLEKEFSNN